ncbi:hypothetical protein K1T71_010157 [Dendrolimus kikuchii]|uniref:Uncharacterized protein n=1 Tax=Dendrolimus kikuchii TaxID=765133 RepID=A0ACC1CR09_9NEOP|nr:hypothetical protein K1T71_010157 [Dendrolimus kikuchii]
MQALQTLGTLCTIEVIANLRNRGRTKVYRKRADPFSLENEEFLKRYRFTKQTATTIIDLVRKDLQLNRKGCGTSPELQVLTALRCWGRHEVQENAGDLHGLSQATTSRICSRVARALARHSADFIKMPTSFSEEQKLMEEFYQIGGFPSVIGSIGCTYIKIKKYGGNSAEIYINKKGFHLLNVQVVCDASLHIRNIVARWRQNAHDSRMFDESNLKESFERGEFKGRLLGDSGYQMESYLFTPLLHTQNLAEERYNEAHIATRNVVDHCFDVWKRRFQCLHHGMSVKFGNITTTIVALAVLHNIAIVNKEPIVTEGSESIMEDISQQPFNIDANHEEINSDALQNFIAMHFNE